MAVDLSIQLFAYELFNHLWEMHGEKSLPFSASTIPEGTVVESHINSDIINAVFCRQTIFREIYILQFEFTNIVCCNSPSDFLAHLTLAFGDDSFEELKVFDRMIATCAFVMEMSLYCCVKGNRSFVKDAFLCWAMYFDTELKSTFYEHGGWKALKRVAKSYELPLLALQTFSSTIYFVHVHLTKFITSVEDFYYFQQFQDQGNQTSAKSWVNFRLENAKSHANTTFKFKAKDGLEDFMMCFKFLCDPMGERCLEGNVRRQNENISSKFKGNEYLENLAMKLSNCHISYPTKQNRGLQDDLEVSPLPEVLQGQTEAEHALTMQNQALEISRLPNDNSMDHALVTQTPFFQTSNLSNESLVNKTNNVYGLEVSPSPELFQGQTDAEQALIMQNQAFQITRSSNDNSIDHALTTQKSFFQTNNLSNESPANKTNNISKNGKSEDKNNRLRTQDREANNCLTETLIYQDRTTDTTINNCLNNDLSVDQDQKRRTKNTGKNLLKDDTSVNQIQEEKTNWYMRRFRMYEEMQRRLKLNNIHILLNHMPVFMVDFISLEEELSPTKIQVKKNSKARVMNENSQILKVASREGQEIQNGTKNKKKKKRKTKSGKSASNLDSGKTANLEADTDDTKDILRMVLVLGCEPGVRYIRSTLKQACKVTSF